MAKQFQWTIEKEDSGIRLDVFLHQENPEHSRSYLKKIIQEGHVQLGGKPVKGSYLLKGGEEISMLLPDPQAMQIHPEDLPLEIIYEDEDMIAVNKPAEWVVHPGAGINHGTLVHALLHHCQDLSGIGGVLRPGIVHRLDKGTSGIILVAKNDRSHQALSEMFKMREIKKTYHALVWGSPKAEEAIIDLPLGRSQRDRKKISSQSSKTRTASTSYVVQKDFGAISFLELRPLTRRTHQLRVHLSEIKHPILGDPTYGKGFDRLISLPQNLQKQIRDLKYQQLHASSLQFVHPTKGEEMTLEAPLRVEMNNLLEELEKWVG